MPNLSSYIENANHVRASNCVVVKLLTYGTNDPGFETGLTETVPAILAYSATVETERDLAQSYDKSPFANRKFENQLTTQDATKNLHYTMIAE